MQASFKDIGIVYHLMDQIQGELIKESYDESGGAMISIKIEKRLLGKFSSDLLDSTAGQVVAEQLH